MRNAHIMRSLKGAMSLFLLLCAVIGLSASASAELPQDQEKSPAGVQAVKQAPAAEAAQVEQKAPAAPATTAQPDPLASAAVEPPETIYLKPKEARFQVISVHLNTPLDGRRLSPKRLITLAVKGEGHIMESFWQRKRLSLYREVIIPSPVEGVPAGVRYEPVGFARVESVMGDVLQAQVEVDGLIKRTTDPTEAMVVMIGDSAKLFVEPAPPPKRKRKRAPKPKPKSPFVREEMKWRL